MKSVFQTNEKRSLIFAWCSSVSISCSKVLSATWFFFGQRKLNTSYRELMMSLIWEGEKFLVPTCQKNTQASRLGKIWPFQAKNPTVFRREQKFLYHIYENHICIVFWSCIASNGPKRPLHGQICKFLAKFGRLQEKNPNFYGWEQYFWYYHIGEPARHLFCVQNIDRRGSNWLLGTKMCNFDPKIWIFWAKGQLFLLESQFISIGHITSMARATFRPPKKLSMSELWVFGCFGVVSFYYKSLCYKSP